MAQRQQLHLILKTLNPNVYFQPPTGLQMVYPAITYKRDFANTEFADNIPYSRTKRYMVTVIDQNADSLIPDKVADLPQCVFVRAFSVGQLNHDIFTIYF